MTDEKFSWVETHNQLTQYLSTKENSQAELIDLLKSVGIGPFNDKLQEGDHDTELEEIDPFTFYCYIYKYGAKKRLKYLQEIAKKLNLAIPKDEKGIPSAQAQKVWLFTYKYDRINNEIQRLWNFFRKAINNKITDADFEDVLQIKSIGKTKLTEALFYINPIRYLPINGPTKPYLNEVLGIDYNFTTYSEYIELLEKIKVKANVPFYELSYEAWKWNNEAKKSNYWLFQGNPKVYDFETALKEELVTDWTVSAHKAKIKSGDKIIIWITGSEAGCYALAEVTSKPHQKTSSPDDHLWEEKDNSSLKAGIKITHNLVSHPILKKDIENITELRELKVGNQGTNFRATQEEFESLLMLAMNRKTKQYWLYAPGENASKWEEFYEEGIMGLGWDEIGDLTQYKSKAEIKKALVDAYGGTGSKKNDVTANDDFLNKIEIGDVVIVKKGRGELLGYGIVNSEYSFDKNRNDYQHVRKVDWKLKGNWNVDFSLVLKTLTDITKYSSDHPDYDTYYEKLMGVMGIGNASVKDDGMNFPLNTILYGPPGTGKTYNTINKALEICGEDLAGLSRADIKARFERKVDEGRILFTTFHQSMTYEDFVEGIKPIEPEKEGDPVVYRVVEGIFRKLCIEASFSVAKDKESVETENVLDFSLTFDNFVQEIEEKLASEMLIELATKNGGKVLVDSISQQGNIIIKHPGRDNTYAVSKQRLSKLHAAIPDLSELNNIDQQFRTIIGGSNSTANWAVLNAIRNNKSAFSRTDKKRREYSWDDKIEVVRALKKEDYNGEKGEAFVLIIDEINRGNVSQIFGELITLIEEDKRLGNPEGIQLQLPYSKDSFGVAPNVYIIGTMNTADRSVEALDTALRRRFNFIEMPPRLEVIETEGKAVNGMVNDIPLRSLLETINKRIEKLLDKDHMIGHSYFLSVQNLNDLKAVFQNRIIPLLQEYFFGDHGKIGLVIGSGFFNIEVNQIGEDFFAPFEDYDSSHLLERKVYHLKNAREMNDETFVQALNELAWKINN